MQSQTSKNGNKTIQKTRRHSNLDIANKDPNFDYCFRTKKSIEEGGGEDMYGFSVVTKGNESGETAGGPLAQFHKSKGKAQIANMDTILCRRPKEISRYFKDQEDEIYNSQLGVVRDATSRSKHKLRALLDEAGTEGDMKISDTSTLEGPSMTQRKGKTETRS